MKKFTFVILTLVAVLTAIVISCSKSTPPPTAEISATIDGYTVAFSPTVTDVDTYTWSFGDGQTSTDASPSHTYVMSGSYTVTLTVKGGGGEATATKDITIAASLLEMLTGGTSAANGKTWILSTEYPIGTVGFGSVTPDMIITDTVADNFLVQYSLDAEYDNEFTFYANGSYSMNPVNADVLAGANYANIMGTIDGEPAWDIGMCAATFTPPTDATWEVHNTDLTVDAITDPTTIDIPPEHANVTFTGKTWISLSDGAYFGVLDFPTTAMFIVKDITADKLDVVLFQCRYGYGTDLEDMMLPTNLVHLTYIPKPAD